MKKAEELYIQRFSEEAKAIPIQMYFQIILLLMIGIEPSAILTFRDEYIRLADDTESAKLAKNVFTIEEFFKI
jgi:hypothetical protein